MCSTPPAAPAGTAGPGQDTWDAVADALAATADGTRPPGDISCLPCAPALGGTAVTVRFAAGSDVTLLQAPQAGAWVLDSVTRRGLPEFTGPGHRPRAPQRVAGLCSNVLAAHHSGIRAAGTAAAKAARGGNPRIRALSCGAHDGCELILDHPDGGTATFAYVSALWFYQRGPDGDACPALLDPREAGLPAGYLVRDDDTQDRLAACLADAPDTGAERPLRTPGASAAHRAAGLARALARPLLPGMHGEQVPRTRPRTPPGGIPRLVPGPAEPQRPGGRPCCPPPAAAGGPGTETGSIPCAIRPPAAPGS